jgi:glucose/arabinose dehydrogenase
VAIASRAQQPAAQTKQKGATPKAIQWPSPPLPDGPIALETALERNLRIVIIKGLAQPWSMAFLPDGAILITERVGRLRIVRNGMLDASPVAGLPEIRAQNTNGLFDLALHPRFPENRLVYFTYTKPAPPIADKGKGKGGGGLLTLARARWTGSALEGAEDIFSPGPGGGSRIVFGKDGMIYMSVGSGADPPDGARAQDPDDLGGKILRLRDDGSVPPDNPFVGRPGYRPEIFTLGHRNTIGLTVHPETGAIWQSENGPTGGDEINVLEAGKNYGWPVVSYGRLYPGPRVSENPWREGMQPPIVFWVPSIATSGLTFYTGDRFPNWKGHLFAGGMRQGEVPRSGHLERIDFNEQWEELHRESMLVDLHNRIRDVRQGPDGLLYVLTAEDDGALLRIEPAGR